MGNHSNYRDRGGLTEAISIIYCVLGYIGAANIWRIFQFGHLAQTLILAHFLQEKNH